MIPHEQHDRCVKCAHEFKGKQDTRCYYGPMVGPFCEACYRQIKAHEQPRSHRLRDLTAEVERLEAIIAKGEDG